MLNTLNTYAQTDKESMLTKPAPQEKMVSLEAHVFLDFKYGGAPVDIMFPDGTTAKLVVGSSGRLYFQVRRKV